MFSKFMDIFCNCEHQKSNMETVHAQCCCGVKGSLAALGDVWCPCPAGQGQQRRVCVTEEWTVEESAPPSAESAEHTRVRGGRTSGGDAGLSNAQRRASARESHDK